VIVQRYKKLPDFNRMRSPITMSVAAIGFVTPSLITAAASGTRARNFSIRESACAEKG
jgi:hypothetical protein